ncbi:AzlD family protein [uncultured Cohaesibacter sp.]|uniref:AzlD family protein n=1 Tax=uncultured Cohaesibacter sp. TaxID=1002546 RepID=UPI0029C7ADDC|nr:AzlD family protein [uncultured Cohaesibacter sp.]
MSSSVVIILCGALVTYLTRIGGHLVLSRFERIHPRVQAGLDAVPAAVLTTLVAPATINGGPNEWIAMGIAILAGFRFSLIYMVAIGTIALVILRQITG